MPKTVLLADDHEDNRAALQLMLEKAGYRTLGARNGQEAVEMALKHCPDLIVMDLAMPVLDGRAATRALKADERTRAIPVVMLTAMALSVDRERLREEGFSGVLFKPVLPLHFLADVRTRIGPAEPDDAAPAGE
ncbi:MAG TPA: response regulator [Longimicrobium sp.]|jgi:two-component system cell cycle response regulator DivK|nr:response regulator [Longimicrobium sp.]